MVLLKVLGFLRNPIRKRWKKGKRTPKRNVSSVNVGKRERGAQEKRIIRKRWKKGQRTPKRNVSSVNVDGRIIVQFVVPPPEDKPDSLTAPCISAISVKLGIPQINRISSAINILGLIIRVITHHLPFKKNRIDSGTANLSVNEKEITKCFVLIKYERS